MARSRPEGSFVAVEFPCTPAAASGTRDTGVGDVPHNTLACRSGDAALSISASVLPPAITALTTDEMLYRRVRRELLRTYDAKQTRWDKTQHAGHACRLLHYDASEGRRGRARLYLDGDKLVVVNAVYEADEATAVRFLDSAR